MSSGITDMDQLAFVLCGHTFTKCYSFFPWWQMKQGSQLSDLQTRKPELCPSDLGWSCKQLGLECVCECVCVRVRAVVFNWLCSWIKPLTLIYLSSWFYEMKGLDCHYIIVWLPKYLGAIPATACLYGFKSCLSGCLIWDRSEGPLVL